MEYERRSNVPLHRYDRPNHNGASIYKATFQHNSSRCLANRSLWSFLCASLPPWSRGPSNIFSQQKTKNKNVENFVLNLVCWLVGAVRVGFSALRENRLPRQGKAQGREIAGIHLESIQNFRFFFTDIHKCLPCSL